MALVSNRRVCIFCENKEQKINYNENRKIYDVRSIETAPDYAVYCKTES